MIPINLDDNNKIATGFIVPENYFDTFSDRLFTKIPEQEIKVISIFSRNKIWIYAAAAIFIIGISIPVLHNFYNKSIALDENILENYIANHSTINDNDIADLLSEKDFQKMNYQMNIEDKTIEHELANNDNLEQYLTN